MKEIGYDIEILSIMKVSNKEHFYEKNHAGNVHQKLVRPRPLFNFAI